MAEITKELGRIPVSRGDYQATAEYYKDNIVQYKRSSYQVVSESPIIGVPPINDEDIVNNGWIIFAGTLPEASLIKSNTQDLSGNNVQENLNSAAEKLKELKLESIYDVSAHNNGKVFESLSAILSSSDLSTLIPTSVRHGGMSIRFIQSSDNKYVQYRLISNSFNTILNNWYNINVNDKLDCVSFIGNDTSWVRTGYRAISGRTYKVLLHNPNWQVPELGDFASIFEVYYIKNTSAIDILNLSYPERNNREKEYIINIPSDFSNSDDGLLYIGGRAVNNEEVFFTIIDITEENKLSELSYRNFPIRKIEDFPIKIRHITDTIIYSSAGNRYTCIVPVEKGSVIMAKSSFGAGLYVGIWETKEKAIKGGSDYLELFGIYGYSTEQLGGLINYDGYLAITTKKSDNSTISDLEVTEFLSETEIYFSGNNVNESPTLIGTNWYSVIPNIDTVNHTIDFGDFANSVLVIYGQRQYVLSNIGKINFFLSDAYSVKLIYDTELQSVSVVAWNATITDKQIVLGVIRYNKANNKYTKFISATLCCDYTIDYEASKTYGNLLYIGNVAQKGYSAVGLNPDEDLTRVSMVDALAIPYIGCTVKFHLPYGVMLGIRSGNRGADLQTNNYWFYDGDTFTFNTSVIYYRIAFANSYDSHWSLSKQKIEEYIKGGIIQIEILNNEECSIIGRNSEQDKVLKALMLNTSNFRIGDLLHTHPVIVHATDIHGDYYRMRNIYEYAKSIKADAVIVTGDICGYQPSDGQNFLEKLDDEFNIPTIVCTGNHDTSFMTTDEQIYNQVVKHFAEKYNVGTTKPYYYQDISGIGIRFISLNIYDGGHTATQEYCNIFRTQMEWFINTLLTTPAGYGVIVLMHSPEEEIVAAGSDTSFISPLVEYPHYHDGMTGTPLKDIIEAFRNKTAGSTTYKNYSEESAITVPFDFSQIDNSVYFIAFVSGHQHEDLCGFNIGTTQPHLNNTNSIAAYGMPDYPYFSNLSDLPRGTNGVTQDCFNVYVIDKSNRNIKVVKIGSTLKTDLTERSHTVIPY